MLVQDHAGRLVQAMFLAIVGGEGDLSTRPLQLGVMLLQPRESENDVVPSQWCNIKVR
jgi:hypothetical protein